MTSAVEKYSREYIEVVKTLDKKFSDMHAGDRMLISSPKTIASYVRQIPVGTIKCIKDMRMELAEQAGADNTCPLTTGIFLRIAIQAHMEDPETVDEVPYWRVITEKHPLVTKLNIPPEYITEKRNSEKVA